jgi:hypothetical protein
MSDEKPEHELCAGCKKSVHLALLDPILLDEENNEVSDELYCVKCFQAAKVVPADRWRGLKFYWLGDGSGHMTGDEARLLCHCLGLEPRDISVMCRAIGRDANPEVCKSWLRSSNGPPAQVCALLWEVEEAVEFVTRHATEGAKMRGTILHRNGDLAQIMFVSIKRLGLPREALQALQIAAWVRCVERLRALDPSRTWKMQQKGDPHPSISPIVE